MTRVTMRALAPADLGRLLEILRETGAFRPEEIGVAEELLTLGVQKGEASGYSFRVAATHGAAVGYACYGPTPCTEGTFDLYWIAVDPLVQGGGVASRLLDETEAEVKARGGRLLVAETEDSPSYQRARYFYEARGFSRAGAVPHFYRPGVAKIIYTKGLAESTGGQ